MRKILSQIDENAERWLLLALYTYIVMVIFVEVARRFIFDYSSIWGEETARYAFIYLVWIAAAAAVRDRAHIRIDVFLLMLPKRLRAALFLFGDLLMGVFAVFVFYFSIEFFINAITFNSVIEGLRVSRSWILFAIPFGFALVIFRISQSMWLDITALINGQEPRPGKRLFD